MPGSSLFLATISAIASVFKAEVFVCLKPAKKLFGSIPAWLLAIIKL